MGWKVIISPSAQSDLADIVRYIALHNSDAAARLGYELITRAESVAAFPEIGRAVPDFQQPHLREVICRHIASFTACGEIGSGLKSSASGMGRAVFLTFPAEGKMKESLPLSLVNDYLYCPRRAALKIVEGWRAANKHTNRGDIVHEHADVPGYEQEFFC